MEKIDGTYGELCICLKGKLDTFSFLRAEDLKEISSGETFGRSVAIL